MKTLVLIAFTIIAPALSQASLILADYKTAGDQLIVRDSTTNLDWLKISVTLGQTPNQSLGANVGFHLATPTEVLQLLTDAGGYTALDGVNRNTNPDLLTGTTMYNLFGPTFQFDFAPGLYDARIWAHVSRPGSSPPVYDMYELDLRHNIGSPGAAAQFVELGNCYDCSSSIEANFLARNSPVPEPASFVLIGAGLVLFAKSRKILFGLGSGKQ